MNYFTIKKFAQIKNVLQQNGWYQNIKTAEGNKYEISGVATGGGDAPGLPDRPFVSMNINGIPVMFYRSSSGTSGKNINEWHPIFGQGENGWLIKGGKIDEETGRILTKIPEIDDAAAWLNTQFPPSMPLDQVIEKLQPIAQRTNSIIRGNISSGMQTFNMLHKKTYGKREFENITPKSGVKEHLAVFFDKIKNNRKTTSNLPHNVESIIELLQKLPIEERNSIMQKYKLM